MKKWVTLLFVLPFCVFGQTQKLLPQNYKTNVSLPDSNSKVSSSTIQNVNDQFILLKLLLAKHDSSLIAQYKGRVDSSTANHFSDLKNELDFVYNQLQKAINEIQDSLAIISKVNKNLFNAYAENNKNVLQLYNELSSRQSEILSPDERSQINNLEKEVDLYIDKTDYLIHILKNRSTQLDYIINIDLVLVGAFSSGFFGGNGSGSPAIVDYVIVEAVLGTILFPCFRWKHKADDNMAQLIDYNNNLHTIKGQVSTFMQRINLNNKYSDNIMDNLPMSIKKYEILEMKIDPIYSENGITMTNYKKRLKKKWEAYKKTK